MQNLVIHYQGECCVTIEGSEEEIDEIADDCEAIADDKRVKTICQQPIDGLDRWIFIITTHDPEQADEIFYKLSVANSLAP